MVAGQASDLAASTPPLFVWQQGRRHCASLRTELPWAFLLSCGLVGQHAQKKGMGGGGVGQGDRGSDDTRSFLACLLWGLSLLLLRGRRVSLPVLLGYEGLVQDAGRGGGG